MECTPPRHARDGAGAVGSNIPHFFTPLLVPILVGPTDLCWTQHARDGAGAVGAAG